MAHHQLAGIDAVPFGRPRALFGPGAARYQTRRARLSNLTGAVEQKGTLVDSSNPYSVLGLGPEATAEEISRAYRCQLRLHHPDTRPAPHGIEQERLERSRLQEAMDAYAVLGNPESRSLYDRELRSENTAPGIELRVRFSATSHPQVVIGPLKWTSTRRGGTK